MPRSSALFTPRPVSGDDVVAAADAVLGGGSMLRSFDDGAVLQVCAGDEVLVSVLRPRMLPRLDEVARLWPGADPSELPVPAFWTEACTPWSDAGLRGLAVLDAVAAAVGGVARHDGRTSGGIG